MDQVALGKRLIAARERAGLTQEQVATMLRCHKSRISKWEHGRRLLKAEDLRELAAIYHCPVDALLGNDDQQESRDPPVTRGDDHMELPPLDAIAQGDVSWQQLAMALVRAMEIREQSEARRIELEREKVEVERARVLEVEAPRARADEHAQQTLRDILDKAGVAPHFARPADEAGAGESAGNA